MQIILRGLYAKSITATSFMAFTFDMQVEFENRKIPISVLLEFDPTLIYKASIAVNSRRYSVLLFSKFTHEDISKAHLKYIPNGLNVIFGAILRIILACEFGKEYSSDQFSLRVNYFHPNGTVFECTVPIKNKQQYKIIKSALSK